VSRGAVGVVALLVALPVLVVIGANFALVYLATSDPSFAVEEDYYSKAVGWDRKREQDRLNSELGWEMSFAVAPRLAADGTRAITATLTDRAGDTIDGARVRLSTFHNARASQILEADLQRREGGGYETSLPLRRPGLWEFRFEVLRDGERMTHTTVRDVGLP
jgi:nitrogen fixation protein FixH